ncbi:methyltransferase domain-containing protein [Nakamurella sp. A5-74]|uniref:Methyltransferase domain-containing protein n=1 Tax=Nakamurella sp. A5-74 TaxID=3158264 RepID=A0AAU8DL55_9ACTN
MSTRYTHGHDESVLRGHRARTAANSAAYLLPHLQPGMAVLDVGSGPGTITADLAELIAPGVVTAVENTADALALTAAELARRGIEAQCAVGDAAALPFPDNSFDVVHAHQVLQHLVDPVAALREFGRVLRPGGVIAVRDADYAAFSWYPAIPALDSWLQLYRDAARRNGGEPDAGTRLVAWAHAAGFTDLAPSASVWSYGTPVEREAWGGMWERRIQDSALATQLISEGHVLRPDLEAIADGWRRWTDDPDAVFHVPHGELIVRG